MRTVANIKKALQKLVPEELANLVDELELPAALDAVEDHIRRRTKRTRNATCTVERFTRIKRKCNGPIHRLPTEILTMILLDVNSAGTRGAMEFSHTLAQVCRRWRDLVLNCPLFWSLITYDMGEAVDAAIRRSGMVKLDIVCDFDVPWTNPADENRFLDRTMALANRVKTISYYSSGRFRQDYVKAVSRYATTIVLSAIFLGVDEGPILDPMAPTEDLIVWEVPVQWKYTNFRHLHSLVLRYVHLLPSSSQLQAIVSECHNLELVAFISCIDGKTNGSSNEAGVSTHGDNNMEHVLETIDSPRLRWLVLHQIPQRITSFFSQRVATDACLHVHMDDLGYRHASDWSSPLFKRLASGPLKNATLSGLKVTLSERMKNVTIEDLFYPPRIIQELSDVRGLQEFDQRPGLFVRAWLDPSEPNPIAKVVDFLADIPSAVSHLSFSDNKHLDRSGGLPVGMEALSRLTSVTHLTIEDSSSYLPLLEYISITQNDIGVPFPRLAALVFDFPYPSEITDNFVQSVAQTIAKRNRLAKSKDSKVSPITGIHAYYWIICLLEENTWFEEAGVTLVTLS